MCCGGSCSGPTERGLIHASGNIWQVGRDSMRARMQLGWLQMCLSISRQQGQHLPTLSSMQRLNRQRLMRLMLPVSHQAVVVAGAGPADVQRPVAGAGLREAVGERQHRRRTPRSTVLRSRIPRSTILTPTRLSLILIRTRLVRIPTRARSHGEKVVGEKPHSCIRRFQATFVDSSVWFANSSHIRRLAQRLCSSPPF